MNVASIGSEGVALIGGGMALLEEVCHLGVGFEVSNAQAESSVSLFLPPMDLSVILQLDVHHDSNGLKV